MATETAVKIEDKDTSREASVIVSTDDPTINAVVCLNPDGSSIG